MLSASGAAFARGGLSLCEEEEPPPPRPIFPCALAESGELGAACADVAFYVVTPGGVLLCQIEVDLLIAGSSTNIERAPTGLPGAPPGGAVHALAAGALGVSPPVAWIRPPPAPRSGLGPRDGHGRPPPTPS
jgi:hypothetical protein